MKFSTKQSWAGTLLLALVCLLNCHFLEATEGKLVKKEELTHHQNQQSALASGASSAVAEKKQGEVATNSQHAAAAALQGPADDEYVEVKPEEINSNEPDASGKDGETSNAAGEGRPEASGSSANRDQKSSAVDEELNAHLAQDTIQQQESSQNGYASLPPAGSSIARAAPAIVPHQMAGEYQQKKGGHYMGRPGHPQGGRSRTYKMVSQPIGYGRAGPHQAPQFHVSPTRLPPSYITLKGKLTGINSIISQYPHPAPGYPHQGPRHLPRGAAAGYAAFRDFVRAQAHKYKAQPIHIAPMPIYNPQVPAYSIPQAASYGGAQPEAASRLPGGYQEHQPASIEPASYEPAPSNGYAAQQSQAGYSVPKPADGSYKSQSGQQKTKVTVAQAYIPHLGAYPQPDVAGHQNSGSYGEQPIVPYTNPVLSRLYGSHAPQGIGKPEYNKDYGMVLHYPQATVYTEPMTVEQLHKLTGGGISQVIEQLQHSLANGYRDESNMIRANNKHHIGHGVTIHAKEYMAPSKSGHYVPTTAAVISTGGAKASNGQYDNYAGGNNNEYSTYQAPDSPMPVEHGTSGYGIQKPVELGSGYERVRQAAQASKQGSVHSTSAGYQNQQYQQPQQQHQQSSSYDASSHKLQGVGEPLTSLTQLLGSELDSLYKANEALTKHLGPEIQAGIQAYHKSGQAKGPLKYTEHHNQRSPFTIHSGSGHNGRYSGSGSQKPRHAPYNGPQRGHHRGPRKHQAYRHQGPRPGHYNQQHNQAGYKQNQGRKQAGYKAAADQAIQQQMQQLLNDFQAGDDQYNGKSTPMINQGYPHKVQKHQQQQQAYNHQQQMQHQQANAYASHEGIEIPQGPNDQVGEIADLVEALKGSLESTVQQTAGSGYSQKQPAEAAKVEGEVRYLASALGQAPSYAAQVPVAQDVGSAYESAKKDISEAVHQPQVAPVGYQQAPVAYQQSQAAYGSQQQPQPAPAPAPVAYQQPQVAYGPQQQPQPAPAPVAYQQPQPAPVAYQQPQPAPATHQQPAPATYQQPNSIIEQTQVVYHGQQQATSGQHQYAGEQANGQQSYGQQEHQVQQQQQQQGYGPSQQQDSYAIQQAMAAYGQQQAGGYGERQPQTNYGGPIHQVAEYQQQHEQYQQSQQQHQQQVVQAQSDYAAQQSGASSGYGSPQSAEPVHQQHPTGTYTNQENTQIINHLVPVAHAAPAAVPQPATNGYEQSQPVSQIGIASPTESQYQQAQPLSSFVDSLPTDYQELLRQPALIDSNGAAASAAASHFGALVSQQESYGQQQQQQGGSASSYDQATSQSQTVVSQSHSQVGQSSQSAGSNSQQTYQAKGSSSPASHSNSGSSSGSGSATAAASSHSTGSGASGQVVKK